MWKIPGEEKCQLGGLSAQWERGQEGLGAGMCRLCPHSWCPSQPVRLLCAGARASPRKQCLPTGLTTSPLRLTLLSPPWFPGNKGAGTVTGWPPRASQGEALRFNSWHHMGPQKTTLRTGSVQQVGGALALHTTYTNSIPGLHVIFLEASQE